MLQLLLYIPLSITVKIIDYSYSGKGLVKIFPMHC